MIAVEFKAVYAWESLLPPLVILFVILALYHLLLYHRDYRSAAYWVALVILSPIFGSILYFLLGINFIRRRGKHYRDDIGPAYRDPLPSSPFLPDKDSATQEDSALAVTLDRISRFEFQSGNHIEPLINGDEAMPTMLEAVRSAQVSISLASYIFEAKGIGDEFIDELEGAVARGVEVRVMVDDAGTRYSWPPVTRELKRRGVTIRRFMPNRFILRILTMNLRNHRKFLIIDGKVAFTGGMNIREGNMLKRNPSHPVRDLHFKVTGPIVASMQSVFAEDWEFCSGECLEGETWFPPLTPVGNTYALGIVDGPDGDMEVMPVALFAALSAARHSVRIITPYFLPTSILMAALKLCATRGVEVTIIVPGCNNIPVVTWASRTLYQELLHAGCRIYESPAPFDHTKILLIDEGWSCIGSTNWDPRSLRLNFEFNLACYDPVFSADLLTIFNQKKAETIEITEQALANTATLERIRNGIARLFIPLL